MPSAADLEPPEALPLAARREWEMIVSELMRLGVLSRFDRGALMILET
jgi:hypothetical protein